MSNEAHRYLFSSPNFSTRVSINFFDKDLSGAPQKRGENDEDDIWSGNINSEDMIFNGDLLEFKAWLKNNKQTIIDTFNLSGEKLKKLESIST